MEFSFDRSRQSNPHSATTNNSTDAQRGQTAPHHAHAPTDEVDTSQIANERLRKAIERNRERQRQREQQTQSSKPASMHSESSARDAHSSAWSQHQAQMQEASHSRQKMEEVAQPSMFDSAQREEPVREEPIREEVRREQPRVRLRRDPRADVQHESRSEPRHEPRHESMREVPTAVATRRSVAKPDDTEFAPVKRTTKRAAAQISYTTGAKKKGKELDPNLINYLVKGSWIFCGFLVLRLIFANGGVVDYFSQRTALNQRFTELSNIKKENMSLVHEIERMQLDAAYQKRLVRDNLGFIAQDEYLILFPKED